MEHLSQNISLIRFLSKKTQTEFGELIGATKDQVASWESKRATPNEIYVGKIADLASLPPEILQKKKLKESEIVLNYTTTISSQTLTTNNRTLQLAQESARIQDLKDQIEELKKDKERLYELLTMAKQKD